MLNQQPSHGYQLVGTLAERQYFSEMPDPGVIYRHLRRMERERLVTSDLEAGGGPARKVYTITEDGRRCLNDWLNGLRRLREDLGKLLDEAPNNER